jgi:hypothetical protein
MTGIGSYLGWYSPVVDVFGKPLSIVIAIILMLLFYAIVKKVFFYNRSNQPENQELAKAILDGLGYKKLVTRISDYDLNKMLHGKYDDDYKKFTFHHSKGKHCCQYNLPPEDLKKKKYIKLKLDFLPKVSTKATLYFDINNDIQGYSFYIKNNNEEIKVNEHSNSIDVNLYDEYNDKYIEFRFDYNDKLDKNLWSEGLTIYLKSFTV